MLEKVYLYLFILCIILAQGIIGTFLNENMGESSNVLDRRRRVINRGEENPVEPGAVPYIINIKKNNRIHCVGTILSRRTVITAARCAPVHLPTSNLTLSSGSTYSYLGQTHNIIERKLCGHHPPRGATLAGIALLIVNPRFEFSYTTGRIDLHTGPILTGMHGTISGWGNFYYGGPSETKFRQRLRSITVPIMNHRECVNMYQGIFPIGDEDICTYHEERQCAHTDAGAGLVIQNKLVGVHIGAIETEGRECSVKPDVFALLQHLEYGQWIRRNIEH